MALAYIPTMDRLNRMVLLAEIEECWHAIQRAQYHLSRPLLREPRFRYTLGRQLRRLTIAVITADRAEQALAAMSQDIEP